METAIHPSLHTENSLMYTFFLLFSTFSLNKGFYSIGYFYGLSLEIIPLLYFHHTNDVVHVHVGMLHRQSIFNKTFQIMIFN